MTLRLLSGRFAVCQVKSLDEINWTGAFVCACRTEDELSVVCAADALPAGVTACVSDWRMLKVEGVLDFGLVGVISRIASVLAAAQVSVFVVSTYNTDYVLVKEAALTTAIACLQKEGYDVTG